MKQQARHFQVQLAIVGAGLAGLAAAVFAQQHGISTAQVGKTGAIAYTTGYLDLLGYFQGRKISDSRDALARLRQHEPQHPLSRISNEDIHTAFSSFVNAITDMGISYSAPQSSNQFALTPAGTLKPTCSVPLTMLPGIDAMRQQKKTLVIDFAGLQGFSAREMVANLQQQWPALSFARIGFPDMQEGEQHYPEVMARMLEVPDYRQQFAERINAVSDQFEAIGMPAIMGIHEPDKVHAELQRLTGKPLFEIPTMPPAVPGIRLREMCEQVLPKRGVVLVPQQKVQRLALDADAAHLHLQDSYGDVTIVADSVLLATGRFMSGGLAAERDGVRETLLSLPVSQPADRSCWYQKDYFDRRGHPVNRAGVCVDNAFRPIDTGSGEPVDQRLFAAGAVLANQDWVRQRCGAGVAIASAWKAVQAVAGYLDR